uniref:GIF2 n=1 Tax=Arundo donax TaxID=35708 RepID=A0A0A9GX23_ARUDO
MKISNSFWPSWKIRTWESWLNVLSIKLNFRRISCIWLRLQMPNPNHLKTLQIALR